MLVQYKTIPSLFNDIDELFDITFPALTSVLPLYPNYGVSVKDTGDALNVTVELPGVAKEDVKVTLHDGVLTVVADRKQPELKEGEQWIRNEVSYGKFERTINLPCPVVAEKISATHENGILQVILPKTEESKPKQIAIR